MNAQRLLVALAFALLGSGTLTWQLNRHLVHATATAPALPSQVVIVAAHDMAPGERIVDASLMSITIPAKSAIPGLLSRPKDLVNHVLTVPVTAGEPILLHEVSSNPQQVALDNEIPMGMRLVSLSGIDQAQASAELLVPGTRVDVLVSYRADPGNAFITSLVLQDILVRTDERKALPNPGLVGTPAKAIGLLVTPEQAARLTNASSLGKLTFALRNQSDKEQSSGLSHVTVEAIGGARRPVAEVRSVPVASQQQAIRESYAVETLSGGKVSTQTFQEGRP